MTMFSLNALIDDILLIVRNNAISESEDLSRAQIEQWIHHYRAMMAKQDEEKGYDMCSYEQEISPLQLEKISINEIDNYPINNPALCPNLFYYRTKEPIPKVVTFHGGEGIIHVVDMHDCTIQHMSRTRRHFQWMRKYTGTEYTYHTAGDYVIVQGLDGLRFIKLIGVFQDPTEAGLDPDAAYPIPPDKIGTIKKLIFDNELAFMLSRPSDDKNNASLAGLKPNNNE